MYSRKSDGYRDDGQMIPPNYAGSAFGGRRRDCGCDGYPTVHRPPEKPERPPLELPPVPDGIRTPLFGGLRGRGPASDDILIAALTVLMIASGADDEAVLLMILLFVCAFV